ncbi:MAG: hydantoinase B/oxoprolinase family protein [Bauldia sp.]|nr:hydantoinase B/oxoprolinase family protein [Bauldia sp.]
MSEVGGDVQDGVQLALLSRRFESVARKMANTLFRTARSGVINIGRDFSCCVVTRENELLVSTDSLPIHVLSGPDQMAATMKRFHPDLRRGDAYLHNSPYHGGSHAADHTILVPVIDDAGEHHFTVIVKAHQADCGNSQPTTYMGTARDVYEEGALIFPAVQVEKDYRTNEDIVRMCEMRIRVPDQWWGDYLAMIGAARIGEREVLALAGELGWEALHSFCGQYFDYSEKRMIAAIGQLPGGSAERVSTHDPFPGTPEDGVHVRAKVAIDPDAAMIAVDLTENIDCLPSGLNLSEACARTAAMVGVFNSLDHNVPRNAGSFRRLDVRLRENCVVGIPAHPASCSVATSNLSDRVTNAVQGAIAEIADNAGLAEGGAVIPPSMSVVSGVDPDTGHPFVNQVLLGFSGGPAAPTADAWQTLMHVGAAGMCFMDGIELDELRQPIVVHARRFLPDTEGPGRRRGANSLLVEFGPRGATIDIMYASDGTLNAARGVRGGLDGAPAVQARVTGAGNPEALPICGLVHLKPGDSVRSSSAGGAGYGPPREREPELVARDVAEGWITAARAREVYGVVLDDGGKADLEATESLRAAKPATGGESGLK